jgi:hypothetical protein
MPDRQPRALSKVSKSPKDDGTQSVHKRSGDPAKPRLQESQPSHCSHEGKSTQLMMNKSLNGLHEEPSLCSQRASTFAVHR